MNMNRIITDFLVQDPLPLGAEPAYMLDHPNDEIYCLNALGMPEQYDNTKSNPLFGDNVLTPLIELDEPWNHPFRKLTPKLKSLVESVIVKAAENTKNKFRATSFKEAYNKAKLFLGAKEIDLYSVLISKNQLNKSFYNELYDIGFDNNYVSLETISLNKLYFFPIPEFVGVLAIKEGNEKIGSFVISSNIVEVELV